MFWGNLPLKKDLSHVCHVGLHCLKSVESRSGSECGKWHSPDTKPNISEGGAATGDSQIVQEALGVAVGAFKLGLMGC